MGVLKSRLMPGISPSFAKAFGVLGHPLYLIFIPFPSSISGTNSTIPRHKAINPLHNVK